MAKAKKQDQNRKPARKISFLKALAVLVGADLLLLFTPGLGILNGVFYIGSLIAWSATLLGLALLAWGFSGLYRQ